MAPRGRAEHGPDLLVQPVRRDHRRKHGAEDDQQKERGADRRRRAASDRVEDDAAARAHRLGFDDGAGLPDGDAHSLILGSSLK